MDTTTLTPNEIASRYKGQDLAPELDIQVNLLFSSFYHILFETAISGQSTT